jgi:hypothetical protein
VLANRIIFSEFFPGFSVDGNNQKRFSTTVQPPGMDVQSFSGPSLLLVDNQRLISISH